MASIFDSVEKGPPIEVFALNAKFLADNSPDKVNLGVGGELRNHKSIEICFVISFEKNLK